MSSAVPLPVSRSDLAQVFTNPRTLKAFEKVLQQVTPAGSTFTTGDLKPFAGATAPDGWLVCDGSAVSRAAYPDLFTAIGSTWGAGDGATTFNLPDLRDRTLMGASATKALGSIGGAASVVLTVDQLPVHNHPVTDPGHTHVVNDPQHTHVVDDPGHGHGVTDPTHEHSAAEPSGSSIVASGTDLAGITRANTSAASTGIVIVNSPTGVTNQAASTGVTNQDAPTGVTVGDTGSGDAVPTLPPWAAITYLIKT